MSAPAKFGRITTLLATHLAPRSALTSAPLPGVPAAAASAPPDTSSVGASTSTPFKGVKISISPPYVQRLVAMEIEERQRNERLTRAHSASADESLRVMVYWHSKVLTRFIQNGDAPDIIPVDIDPAVWPKFQPGDSAELVARFKVDTERYQYFDWKLYAWVSASALCGPRNVVTAGELHYRSLGVEYGPNMPGCDPTPDHPSHLTPRANRNFGYLQQQASMSVAALAAPPFPSSLSNTPSGHRVDPETSPAGLDTSGRTPAIAPLPSLLSAAASAALADVSQPPPEGPHGWPLRYFIDMALGFQEMRRLQDNGVGKQAAFEQAFGRPRVHNTFYGNYRASTLGDDALRKLLRTWVKKPNTINLVPDGEPLVLRAIQEGLSVLWDRVSAWHAVGEVPSRKVPQGEARRAWLVDVEVYAYVRDGAIKIPAPSASRLAPLRTPQRSPSMSPLTEFDRDEDGSTVPPPSSSGEITGPRERHRPPGSRPRPEHDRKSPPASSSSRGQGAQHAARNPALTLATSGRLHQSSVRSPHSDVDFEDATPDRNDDDTDAAGSPERFSLSPSFVDEYAHGLEQHLAHCQPGPKPLPADTLLDKALRACGYDAEYAQAEWGEAATAEDGDDEFIWECDVDVVASGVDWRGDSRGGRRRGGLLKGLPMRYYLRDHYVAVDPDVLVDELARVLIGHDSELYISVPMRVDEEDSYEKLAVITDADGLELLAEHEIPLRPLDASQRPPHLRNAHFAIDLEIHPVVAAKVRNSGRSTTSVRDRSESDRDDELGRPALHTYAQRHKRRGDSETSRSRSPERHHSKRHRAGSTGSSHRQSSTGATFQGVLRWIEQAEGGRFQSMPAVQEMRQAGGTKSHEVRPLLRWSKAVAMIVDLGQTDDRADHPAKHVKITQDHVGAFISRGPEWVGQATQVRRLYDLHRHNESVRAEIKRLEELHHPVGMKRLLQLLKWCVKSPEARGPHPLLNTLPAAALAPPPKRSIKARARSSSSEADSSTSSTSAQDDDHPGGCIPGAGLGPRPLANPGSDSEGEGASDVGYESWGEYRGSPSETMASHHLNS
ncbi:hypothetical protein C8Q76DRAFT_694145 [Earliella scabrosa]|nr:hypothetical protein C8Q76DRAFT_694145 [Earliella scabrosa]